MDKKRFDPYYRWLGIRPEEQPVDHYRLLGVLRHEADLDVIENACDQRMSHVRTFQSGKYSSESQAVLNHLSMVRICLLDPTKKEAYDNELLAVEESAAPAILAAGPPAAAMPAFTEPSPEIHAKKRKPVNRGRTKKKGLPLGLIVGGVALLLLLMSGGGLLLLVSAGSKPVSVAQVETLGTTPSQLPIIDDTPFQPELSDRQLDDPPGNMSSNDKALANPTPDNTLPFTTPPHFVPTEWDIVSYRRRTDNAVATSKFAHSGKYCAQLYAPSDDGLAGSESATADDIRFTLEVPVKQDAWYLFSGWIKTENVETRQGKIGANLSLENLTIGGGHYKRSESITGTQDWSYQTVIFHPARTETIMVAARLGNYGSVASGTAWFDDLCLIEIELPDDPDDEKYQSPDFLDAARLEQNLLVNPGFELLLPTSQQ